MSFARQCSITADIVLHRFYPIWLLTLLPDASTSTSTAHGTSIASAIRKAPKGPKWRPLQKKCSLMINAVAAIC